MATTKLSDLIVPELWTPNFLLEDPALIAFFNSGIVAQDNVLASLASGEGSTFHIRHMNDLGNDTENSSSDDDAQKSTPKKVTGGEQIAVKLMRNQSWSSMDLAAALHSPDPVATIRSRIASYWARRFQAAAIAVLNGVLADNTANDSGDMLYDHSASGASDKTIAGDAIINATATMGDRLNDLDSIAMHSVQYANLQKRQLIQYLRDGEANINFPTYLGRRVIVDDGLPVTGAGTQEDPFKYLAVLSQSGTLRMGFGTPKNPMEVERVPDAGNGEGQEIIYSRQHFILHPAGFKYKADTFNPSNTVLATGATWDRVFARKQVPVAFLRTL